MKRILFLVLAILTVGAAAFAGYPGRRRLLVAAAAAGVPMSLAMATAIAVTQRYTADFCPLLLVGAAFGAAAPPSPCSPSASPPNRRCPGA